MPLTARGCLNCFCETCCCAMGPTIKEAVETINRKITQQLNDDGYVHERRIARKDSVVDQSLLLDFQYALARERPDSGVERGLAGWWSAVG